MRSTITGICYLRSSVKASFEDAKKGCAAVGGILAEPKSEYEYEMIVRGHPAGEFEWIGITMKDGK